MVGHNPTNLTRLELNELASVLVLGEGINALGIVRNLARNGVSVHCVSNTVDPVAFSRFCSKWYLIPGYLTKKNLLKTFLLHFAREVPTPIVVFLTNDLGLVNLSDLQYELNADYRFVTPSKEISEILVLKNRFYESLSKNSIPHPNAVLARDVHDLRNATKELGFPIFLKPSLSQAFSRIYRKKGFVANNPTELERHFALVRRQGIEVVLQEIIPGPDTNLFGISGSFDHDGRPLSLFGYHRLRGWPPLFGNSSLMESTALSDLAVPRKMVVEYLARLGYYGLMDAEFKLDPRDGVFKLLEINPRSWWQNSFPAKCGLNIILRSYHHALGKHEAYSEQYTPGMKWLNGLDDIRSSLAKGKIGRLEWIRSFSRVTDFAFFDPTDLGPLATANPCTILQRIIPSTA